ncbi:YdcF family protein [Fertoebacter nigrum]|uniref:YdcF family protein n=1 Tax=Fertoeibacter niger TaxID=2656921 RepID=A0A8X8H194_9RHOB|nr:YdcF family protein [Fertoeibacter niger]
MSTNGPGVVIVLGAAVWPGGQASPTLRRRAEHGARVFLQSGAALLITTGGTGRHPPAEALVAAAICRRQGVPAAAILCEDQSTTTLDNLRFATPLVPPGARITIVTDYYHIPRALLTARMLGLRARGAALGFARADINPRQHARMILREAFALPAYALRLLWRRWRG